MTVHCHAFLTGILRSTGRADIAWSAHKVKFDGVELVEPAAGGNQRADFHLVVHHREGEQYRSRLCLYHTTNMPKGTFSKENPPLDLHSRILVRGAPALLEAFSQVVQSFARELSPMDRFATETFITEERQVEALSERQVEVDNETQSGCDSETQSVADVEDCEVASVAETIVADVEDCEVASVAETIVWTNTDTLSNVTVDVSVDLGSEEDNILGEHDSTLPCISHRHTPLPPCLLVKLAPWPLWTLGLRLSILGSLGRVPSTLRLFFLNILGEH